MWVVVGVLLNADGDNAIKLEEELRTSAHFRLQSAVTTGRSRKTRRRGKWTKIAGQRCSLADSINEMMLKFGQFGRHLH